MKAERRNRLHLIQGHLEESLPESFLCDALVELGGVDATKVMNVDGTSAFVGLRRSKDR